MQQVGEVVAERWHFQQVVELVVERWHFELVLELVVEHVAHIVLNQTFHQIYRYKSEHFFENLQFLLAQNYYYKDKNLEPDLQHRFQYST